MKKITLVLLLIFMIGVSPAQVISTGVLDFDSAFGRTVQFDVNTSTNIVTMTMIFPDNTWFAVAMANDGIVGAESMGDPGDDVIVGTNSGIEDRKMNGATVAPPLDTNPNDWSLISNTVDAGVRTIVGTRVRDTGDAEDFIFPNVTGPLPMLYAARDVTTFNYHSEGMKGFKMHTFSSKNFEDINVSMHPNPASSTLNITLPSNEIQNNLDVTFYNVLGKKIFQKAITKSDTKISVANWSNGVYVMKLSSGETGKSITKRFIKI